MAVGFGELKVFSGSAHPDLAREIAGFLGVSMGQARLKRLRPSSCAKVVARQPVMFLCSAERGRFFVPA